MPPAPARAFASDNAAGAHPKVVEAVLAANEGHALAYGSDEAAEGRDSFLEKRPAEFTMSAATDMPDFFPWWEERRFS